MRYFFALLFLINCFLNAVEERDYFKCWGTPKLPGAESLPSIDADELKDYSFSVTYALDGGRFGDQLLNYLKALWVSWKFNLPLIFRPFDYSNELMLSEYHEISLNEEVIRSFSAQFGYFSDLDFEKSAKVFSHLKSTHEKNLPLLWNIGLLTPLLENYFCEKLDDEDFRSLLQKLVKPKNEISLLSMPMDRKTIAIHVRTGKDYDWEINIRNMPTKFPPETFYLGALKQAAAYFGDEPLYVHIFTDHPEPPQIEARLMKEFNRLGLANDVIFNCRREGNSHTQNVVEDMFSMAEFDCLIRPDSSLSQISAILGAPILEIRPSRWGQCRVDKEGALVKDKQGRSIVDLLVVLRLERGRSINEMFLAPVESSILFD